MTARSTRTAPQLDILGKVPPQSIELKEAVIGAVLIEKGYWKQEDVFGKLINEV